MMEFLLIAVIAFIWWSLAGDMKKKGRGWFVRNVIAGTCSNLLVIVGMAIYFIVWGEPADSASTERASSAIAAEAAGAPPAPAEDATPESTKGEMWQYLVNNAKRAVNRHAYDANPDAAILGGKGQVAFELQQGGEHDGRHLLTLTHHKDGNVMVATLLPLFDEYAPSDDLDDEAEQWKILEATFNGRPFGAGPELVAAEKQFDFTPAVFEQRFNRIISENTNLSLSIDASKIESGQVNDTVTSIIGKHTAGVLVVDKVTGNLLSVTVIGSGDGSIDSGAEIMAVGAAAQAAAAQAPFNDVLTSISGMIEGEKPSINGVKLSVTQSSELGTWFIAEPI